MQQMLSIMDTSQAQAWVILIAAVSASVVSIISAIKSKSNGAKLDVINRKSDEIHVQVNSNLTDVKAKLEIAWKDIEFLKEFISKNTTPPKPPDPDKPEQGFVAKIELAPPPSEEPPKVSLSSIHLKPKKPSS